MKKYITLFIIIMSLPLLVAYGLSLLARAGWFFDIFSHFAIQYAFFGLILGTIFASLRFWPGAALLFIVALLNMTEIYSAYSRPWLGQTKQTVEANLHIVQYNRLWNNANWDDLQRWVTQDRNHTDILLIQESSPASDKHLSDYKDTFPYQFPNDTQQRFSDVSILSKHPFQIEKIMSKGKYSLTNGTKIILQKPDVSAPIHIYSIHSKSPLTHADHKQQHEDIGIMERAITADRHPYKIFAGDWNLTPYAPLFQDLLRHTGMQYNDDSLWPKTTWNSHLAVPFLQIPIDHIIYSPAIIQIEKRVGPSLGSDHHMLIASYYIPES